MTRAAITATPLALAARLSLTSVEAQRLTVCTALESDLLPVYKSGFEAGSTGITLRRVRDPIRCGTQTGPA